MGLLDDAIREHLDLKRRRGADPAEIERAEQEALGPVRRDFQDEDGHETLPAEDEEFAEEEAGSEDFSDELESDEGELEGEADALDQRDQVSAWRDEQPEDREPPGAPEAYAGSAVDAEATAPEEPEQSSRRHSRAEGPGSDTVEFDVESSLQHDDEAMEADVGDGEDVLEETPEFLQDAPDHDRLWFEQRPPRDFDFDK
jgi:hypothetical protein